MQDAALVMVLVMMIALPVLRMDMLMVKDDAYVMLSGQVRTAVLILSILGYVARSAMEGVLDLRPETASHV
jgi:hypothetical protein